MRKSREVPVTILAAIALSSIGCHDTPENRNCVDEQGRIVPDTYCQSSVYGAHYRYLYGGASGGHYGDSVVGGSTTSNSESGVSRGGFGHDGGGEDGGE